MPCKQSNNTTIQADVLDRIQESRHCGPKNAIDKCYNNKIIKKAIMQIKRKIAKNIFLKFNNFYSFY